MADRDLIPRPTRELRELKTRDLLGELVRQAGVLLKAEARLIRLDVRDAARRAEQRAVRTGAAMTLLHTGLLLVAAAVFLGLAEVVMTWLAALMAGALFLGGGAVLLRLKSSNESQKENDTWTSGTSETASSEKPTPRASA